MAELFTIQIDYDNTEFTPGDIISGTLTWNTPKGTEGVVLRLFWFTSGRGTQDIELVDELAWSLSTHSPTQGSEKFAFTLPREPYSFSGRVVSLSWALEAVALPNETAVRREFTLTPNGQSIVLDQIDQPVTAKIKSKWFRTSR